MPKTKTMRSLIFIVFFSFLVYTDANSQGCVAIRGVGGICTIDHKGSDTVPSKWTLNLNTRYFNSFRHYVGTAEQKHRIANKTQVINNNVTVDMSLIRVFNSRWSMAFSIPMISNTRTSLYEHGGAARHLTTSFGLGDARVSGYYWVTDPAKGKKFALQAGLGDGGTGFTTEINAFQTINRQLSLYGNFFYLLNPREHNGVSTARGGTPSTAALQYGSDVMSVPDQYMIRVGVNYTVNRFTFSAGYRHEAVPSSDLIGGSYGFRRPGYVNSIEPGITYSVKKLNLYAYVPVAVVRSRTQSYADKHRTKITGVYAQGDAAFADLAVNVGMSLRF